MNRNTLQALATELSMNQKNAASRLFKSPFKRFLITDEQEEKLDQYYFDIENNRIKYDKSDSATQWIVDNYYTLKMQLKSIKRSVQNIPNSIPVLKNGIMKGFPRIYAIAVEYVDFNGGTVDECSIKTFLAEYQIETPLKIDELWSLSSAFSLALARNIVTLAARHYEFLQSAEKIRKIAENINIAEAGNLSEYVNINDTLSLAVLVETIQNRHDNSSILRWLDSELLKINMTANEVIEFSRRIESNSAITIRNTITSIMNINMFDWEDIFSAVSLYDKVFEKENGSVFANSDKESKNLYRQKLKEYAEIHLMNELECADYVVSKANDSNTHIADILFGDQKRKTAKRKCIYFAAVYGIVLLSFYFMLTSLIAAHTNVVLSVAVSVISLIPIKSIVLIIVNLIASKIVKPKKFLKLNFEHGIPEEYRTVVLVPALITSEKDAKSLVENMEINFIANKSRNVSFVLLGDLKESDCESSVDDDKIKEFVVEEIAKLNKKYIKNIFFYMQRPRQFNKTQECWFGWERKRGAVIQFNRFVQTGDKKEFSYMSPGIDSIVGTRYIVTLDADTKIPPSGLCSIVATAAHPANRPVFDPETKRVVSGYGILQPRMDVGLPSALKTRFSLLMAGNVGSEPYSSSVSEIYQDIFDEANFGGKGVYDSKVFEDVIDGRFPDNAILSHDMIEGGYLRAGYVSDISFSDDIPSNYISYKKRSHRWLRGDWQLLPYLFPLVKNSDGEKIKNVLYSDTKYKIFENLRQSLFDIVICLLFVIGIFDRHVFIAGAVLCLVNSFLPFVFDVLDSIKLKLVNNENKKILPEVFVRSVFSVMLSADTAFYNADAVVRTLSRLKSGKKLLEWQTAMQTESKNGNSVKKYYSFMRYSVIFSVILVLVGLFYKRWIVFLFGAAFAVAPIVMYECSKTRKNLKHQFSVEAEEVIEHQAKGAWRFFKELCNEENNFLPPDNFQEEPYKGSVDRTSTTNIGMMLISVVCAVKLGYTDVFCAVELCENVLKTLSKLEKWNGHPYNWYNIKTLKPLEPKFVSTADNGNLCCSLIVLREALNEYRESITDDDTLFKISESEKIINDFLSHIDFSKLYDFKKDLFSVGYNIKDGVLSRYSYDLFASEARLASFFAIVNGQVPARHWSRLSRIVVKCGRRTILKSWSGSMFEYLMPALMMRTYDKTLVKASFTGIVNEQIRYGNKAGRAWGISESGYWLFDDNDYYQYKAFGVPYAAVRHISTNEYVIAPYATALAFMIMPKKAADNLLRLKRMGLCGQYGFYEACDISENGEKIVKSFMAHHEGMSIAAITNYMYDNYIAELFHKAPEVKAGEILLQEKQPLIIPKDAVSKKTIDKSPEINQNTVVEEVFHGITANPHCTLLTNGTLSLLVGNTGGNLQFTRDILLNKWRSNDITEHYGHFIFIRDEENKNVFSVSPSPLYNKCLCNVVFRFDSVSFYTKQKGLETTLNITISPEKNAVIYALSIKNTQARPKHFTVVDYIEPSLESDTESRAHPAYSDMFIETNFERECNCIIAQRFPHKEDGKNQYMAISVASECVEEIYPIMSRYDMIGRNRNITNPILLEKNFDLRNVRGTGLCPSMSVAADIEIQQGRTAEIVYTVMYSESYDNLIAMGEYFKSILNCMHEFESAYEHARLLMQYKNIDEKLYRLINSIVTRLYYPQSFNKKITSQKKSFMWKFGISGDYPIMCIVVEDNDMSGVELFLTAYERMAGTVNVDLVIITYDDGYHSDIYESVKSLVSTSARRDMLGRKGGIFILRGEQDNDCNVVKSFASVIAYGNEQNIYSDLLLEDKYVKRENITILPKLIRKDASKNIELPELIYFNGYGGFSEERNEYTILLDNGVNTPHPWSNILANSRFGSVVTESGGGYTWYKNSYENKLTSWNNDPVSDVPSEAIYIKDEATMQYMTPQRIVEGTGKYVISYGRGYAKYYHNANKLNVVDTVFVPEHDSVKISILEIENENDITKKLSVYYYADCNLSPSVASIRDDILVKTEKANGIVFAENMNMPENGYMFLASNGVIDAVLTKKMDFFGRTGGFSHPKALDYSTWNVHIGKTAADCMVIKTSIEVKPHSKVKKIFLLGGAENYDSIRSIKSKYADGTLAENAFLNARMYFSDIAQPFKITTNDKALDMLFNNFLMYQVYVCRYTAKTSFYQCSGAYGFRDQLQDVLAFMYCNRKEARNHILRAAEQQFETGDVRHWWHEDTGYGIRTKISDDLIFLPYVCLEYARYTGDWGIFDEEVPFIKNVKIEDGKTSYFGKAEFTQNRASIYEHCMLAIRYSMRLGNHNLPLIGTGDWNDGFDKVGKDGKGESVWLAFFIHYVIRNFSSVCIKRDDNDSMRFIAEYCAELEKGIKENSWDGSWYRRAYYDDGTPIGSRDNDECKIDVIAQSWAAIANITPFDDVGEALQAVDKYLVDRKNAIVKLFSPPFKNTERDPGYIKAYRAGIRENGGQYTHGAIWLVMAYAVRGEADKAYEVLKMLNPVNHTKTKTEADIYKVEPYVMAADVYSLENNEGMGGWTWYTGSAAWMYKVILENILGIKIMDNIMSIKPCVPENMLPFRVEYRYDDKTYYLIDVIANNGEYSTLDGEYCDNNSIVLDHDEKKHKIIVVV